MEKNGNNHSETRRNPSGNGATNREYVLFAGNPGSGKSTILNCLMTSRSPDPLHESQRFKSGVAIASGMTYQLDKKEVCGVTYMDTPGLDDVNKRKQAAEAITKALRENGKYQVIFVVTLEAGRVKPADVATIQLILESAKEITHYGVIFNKLSKPVMKKLTAKDGKMALITQVSVQPQKGKPKPLPFPLFLKKDGELEDEDDAVAEFPELDTFFGGLPYIDIKKENVHDIPTESFEAMKSKLEDELDHMKKDRESMKRQMDEDRKNFRRTLEEMNRKEQMERERFEKERERSEKNHDSQMDMMKTQIKETKEQAAKSEVASQKSHEAQMKKDQLDHALAMKQLDQAHQRRMKQIDNNKRRGFFSFLFG
eukprot:TCONS_00043884-protein